MAVDIVDSRDRKRSSKSVQKYIERNKRAIHDAIKKKIADSNIGDLLNGQDKEIDVRKGGITTDQPNITYDQGTGVSDGVLPGNNEHSRGDTYDMQRGGGGRGNEGGEGEEAVDSFKFRLTSAEFLDLVFDTLALPNMVKKIFVEEDSNIMQRSGYTTEGAPSRLSIIRTYRQALGRTLSEKEQYRLELEDEEDEDKRLEIEKKISNIAMFRDLDLRYTHWTPAPTIKFKSVLFLIMDVSGSMCEPEKTLAKGFFLLYVLFLRKCYNDVEIVFIRHTTEAEEVDEHTFFYDPKNGGTKMSPALELVDQIIKDRYDLNTVNIYCAQASDGDNIWADTPVYLGLLENTIIPQVQYFIYIEVKPNDSPFSTMRGATKQSEIMGGIAEIAYKTSSINAAVIRTVDSLYKVFTELFSKKDRN